MKIKLLWRSNRNYEIVFPIFNHKTHSNSEILPTCISPRQLEKNSRSYNSAGMWRGGWRGDAIGRRVFRSENAAAAPPSFRRWQPNRRSLTAPNWVICARRSIPLLLWVRLFFRVELHSHWPWGASFFFLGSFGTFNPMVGTTTMRWDFIFVSFNRMHQCIFFNQILLKKNKHMIKKF